MINPRRRPLSAAIVFVAATAAYGQQDRQAVVRAIQVAEDSRATDSAGIQPIRAGLRSSDTAIQAMAVRAMGRLEQLRFAEEIIPLLRSPDAAVRVEAANALAQLTMERGAAAAARSAVTVTIFGALRDAVSSEQMAHVRLAVARSITRLPLNQPDQVRFAESLALSLVTPSSDSAIVVNTMLALERLVRLHARVAPPLPATIDTLKRLVVSQTIPSPARRYAFMTLTAAGQMDAELLTRTFTDPDAQVRRLSATSISALQGVEQRDRMMNLLLRDSAQMVRLEVVRGWLRRGMAVECVQLLRSVDDVAGNVAIGAIDALTQAGERCPAGERPRIDSTLAALATVVARDGLLGSAATNRIALHKGAHALVTLARLSPLLARNALPGIAAHTSWIARMYAARAADVLRDTSTLTRLGLDGNANVRADAITGLIRVAGLSASPVYIAAIAHSDYNVVRIGASGLRQSQERAVASRALFAALARITREQKETSRDARMALLERIGDLASPSDSTSLRSYLTDFDPSVAVRAAETFRLFTGRPVTPAPRRPAAADRPPVDAGVAPGTRLRFIMAAAAGGGVFEMALLGGEAPYTAVRLVRLARAGYYNGLTFHRIAPNFVVQGGSPGANEYVGDGPFMRDEIWLHSHERGTVGISTRGRDTGDAQIFVNTIDSPRLDFDYTVFARLTYGMPAVDAILEGDVIERVEVLPPR